MKAALRYVFHIAVALDQVANAVLGGYPDETVSIRAAFARNKGQRWGCVLCKLLDFVHPHHCSRSLLLRRGALLRTSKQFMQHG